MNISVWFFIFVSWLRCVLCGSEYMEINTTSGRIKGRVSEWMDGVAKGKVARFYGIPYAVPPVGGARFEPSVPMLSFSDLTKPIALENSNPPRACPQMEHLLDFSDASLPQGGVQSNDEDCLKLNIYKPVTSSDKTKPVLIWIPGDGFNYADSIQFDGSALAVRGDIIVVTVNYRVGVFGFLSSGNATLPGNAGLHDILHAVQWVRKNCIYFHGNQTQITLAGRFSGAMAISALTVSPLFMHTTKANPSPMPLVQRIILHGGVAHGRYVIDYEPHDAMHSLATLTSCKHPTDEATIACLKTVPTEKLLAESMKIPKLWKPVIDHRVILDDPLDQIVSVNKYPAGLSLLIGDNDGAGSLCYLSQMYRAKRGWGSSIELETLTGSGFQSLVELSLQEYYDTSFGMSEVSSLVTHEYLFTSSVTAKLLVERWLYFCGAMYIRYPTELAARSIADYQRAQVFRYEFAQRPESTRYPKWLHASIGDEIIFLFPSKTSKFSKDDEEVQKLLLDSWSSFVKTGKPSTSTFTWPPFDSRRKMVRFGSTKFDKGKGKGDPGGYILINSTNFLDQDVHFWNNSINPLIRLLHQYKFLNDSIKSHPPRLIQQSNPEQSGNSVFCKVTLSIVLIIFIPCGIIFFVIFYKHRRTFVTGLPCRL